MITKLSQLIELAQKTPVKKLSIACPYDEHTLKAAVKAYEYGLVNCVLVGDESLIRQTACQCNINIDKFSIINIKDENEAVNEAVRMVSDKESDMVMKGLISSEKYLKSVFRRNKGLLGDSVQITHTAVLENKSLDRLIFFGDAAILPQPDLKQKLIILNALSRTAQLFGVEKPKVAMIAASEFISPAIAAGVDAAVISKMSQRNQLGNVSVEGPLSIELALDKESVKIKGVTGDVPGNADCLVFPEIEAGNAFYKTNTKLAGAQIAGCLDGTQAPVVMTSRADSVESKIYSIAFAKIKGFGLPHY